MEYHCYWYKACGSTSYYIKNFSINMLDHCQSDDNLELTYRLSQRKWSQSMILTLKTFNSTKYYLSPNYDKQLKYLYYEDKFRKMILKTGGKGR